MRAAAAAFVGAAIFLAGVMVGLGSGEEGDQEAPVAIALVDRGDLATPSPSPVEERSPNVKEIEHPAKQGEADDDSGPGEGEAEYWEEEDAADTSGPGGGDTSGSGGGDDTSGSGGGGGDSSGPGGGDDDSSGSGGGDSDSSGSGSSGSGSDGSGGSSGPG
jgi:uncharacterized membrane protein YgcG